MLRRDEEGVASTVATIFAIFVCLLFLTAAFAIEEVRQADREWNLLHDGQAAFGAIRAAHDLQFTALLIPRHFPDLGSEPSVAVVVPVGMSAASPFTPPVSATLACDPGPSVASIGFSYRAGSAVVDALEPSSGSLSLSFAMRKIPSARLVWENGATLLVQHGGAVVLDYPYFRIEPRPNGVGVTYRVLRLVDASWSVDDTGPQILSVRTTAGESVPLKVLGQGDANLDDVRDFVRALKDEIREASTDGSGRITGSYADNPPSEGILNQGLTEQLVYYQNAELKKLIFDCEGASNDMNASARQLLQNVMDKILEGIDTGYIDPDYGVDLHARIGGLLRCLDEMSGSLRVDCEFACRSLLGGGGGRLEFLLPSQHRLAWGRWFADYFASLGLDPSTWDVLERRTFVLVQIDGVEQITFQEGYVTFL